MDDKTEVLDIEVTHQITVAALELELGSLHHNHCFPL